MKSIAVCISGQVRNDDNALEQTMAALADIDADVFISVWRKRGSKTFGGASGPDHMARIFGPRIAAVIPKNWLGRMRGVFPDSRAIFPSLGDVSVEGLQRYFPDADIDIEDETTDLSFPYSDSNSLRMLYKIWRCNGLKRKREKRRGKPYDLVIRMRPDIALDFARLAKLKLKPEELVTHAHRNDVPNYIQDMYWVGGSQIDNIMAAVFHRAVQCVDLGWKGIHLELSEYIDREGIITRSASYITGNIHHFSKFDAAYEQAVKTNFVAAVAARKMDVDFAGGETYCALAEEALLASYNRDAGTPEPLDHAAFLEKITAFAKINRQLAIVAYLLGASYIVDDETLSFNTRLTFLDFMLVVQQKFGMNGLMGGLMGSIPEAFSGHQEGLLRFIVGEEPPAGASDLAVPAPWLADPLYLSRTAPGGETAAMTLLKTGALSTWILNGVDLETCAAQVVSLTQMRIKLGVAAMPDYRHAAAAYRHLEDPENEQDILEAANEKWNNSAIKAQLGELAFRRQDYKAALALFSTANAMPQCPVWVAARLKACEEKGQADR